MANNQQVATQGTGQSLTVIATNKVKEMLDKNRPALIRSLPAGFNVDRMSRVVINAISTTPAIAECNPGTIFLSAVRAFSCGLEPNGALNEGYLVPFFNSKTGQKECQFMPSYRGLIQLARRSGEISEIYAKTVHEGDEFEVEEGTERHIVHHPDYFGKRGKAIGYYAVFKLKDGSQDFEVMGIDEIETIRKRSKAGNSGPWQTDYDEMAKKTVLKRLLKRAPAKIEVAAAIDSDNKAAMGESQDAIIDIDMSEFEIVDETPAEIASQQNASRVQDLKQKLSAKEAKPAHIHASDIDQIMREFQVSEGDVIRAANDVRGDMPEIAKINEIPASLADKIHGRFQELIA